MKYGKEFFDTYLERRGTRSIKWDGCNEKFGVDPSAAEQFCRASFTFCRAVCRFSR